MSKIMETVEIPATTRTQVRKLKCDLCGAESPDEMNWKPGSYVVHTSTIEMKDGYNVPDSGSVTVTSFDICTTCFKDKLMPWFKSQGGRASNCGSRLVMSKTITLSIEDAAAIIADHESETGWRFDDPENPYLIHDAAHVRLYQALILNGWKRPE